jgi:hypothetical protein
MAQTLESWLSGLPKWLQTAAADLLSRQSQPSEPEIVRLANLCTGEAAGATTGFAAVPEGAFEVPVDGVAVRLRRVESVRGVNALDSSAGLDFADADLTVIYGQNGTGKSGFGRLLKHAAGCRTRAELLPNAFLEQVEAPSATFVVERGDAATTHQWTASGGAIGVLRRVQVFDGDVSRHYLTAKAEATYEPRRMRFLGALVEICDGVRAELEARKARHPSRLPVIPADLADSSVAGYLRSLKASVEPESVRTRLLRKEGHAERHRALDDALRTPDLEVRIAAAGRALDTLRTQRLALAALSEGLSDDNANDIVTKAGVAALARRAATELATSAFADSKLSGTGEPLWRVMWEAARQYSVKVAYPSHDFPHSTDDGFCPLCQQSLDGRAQQRLSRFESFVRGEVEKNAREAEDSYRQALATLPNLPAESDWVARFGNLIGAADVAAAAHAAAATRSAAIAGANDPAVVPSSLPAVDFRPLLDFISVEETKLTAEKLEPLVETPRAHTRGIDSAIAA